jgi:hypothetical protein
VVFVDRVVARALLTGPVLVAVVDVAFFVTRDFDSIACARVVVGMLAALVFLVFAGCADVVVTVSASPARARVVRRGLAGLAGLRGAILITS